MDWELIGKAATAIVGLFSAGFTIKMVVNRSSSQTDSSRKTNVKQSGNFAMGDIVGGDKVTHERPVPNKANEVTPTTVDNSTTKP